MALLGVEEMEISGDKWGNPDLTVSNSISESLIYKGQSPNMSRMNVATAKMNPPTTQMKQTGLAQHYWLEGTQQPSAWLSYLSFGLQRAIQYEATGSYYSEPKPSGIAMSYEQPSSETLAYLRQKGVLNDPTAQPKSTTNPTTTSPNSSKVLSAATTPFRDAILTSVGLFAATGAIIVGSIYGVYWYWSK